MEQRVGSNSRSVSRIQAYFETSKDRYYTAAQGFKKAADQISLLIYKDANYQSVIFPLILLYKNLIVNQLKDIVLQKHHANPNHHNILNLWQDVKEIITEESWKYPHRFEIDSERIINIFCEIDDISFNFLTGFEIGEIDNGGNFVRLKNQIEKFSDGLEMISRYCRNKICA